MATNFGKTLVRRLIGKKGGGRPQAIYTHPSLDKIGPMAGNIGSTPIGKPPVKGKI